MKGCYNKAIQRKTRRQRLPLQQMSMPVVLQPNTKVTNDRIVVNQGCFQNIQQLPFSPSFLTLPFLCTSIVHSMCCIYRRPGPNLGVAPVMALSLCTKIIITASHLVQAIIISTLMQKSPLSTRYKLLIIFSGNVKT